MEELIGKELGQYQIKEKIGEGGMASVFKAYQPSLDRYVALKVLPPKFAQNPVFVKRFSREARSIARLHHPNILPVYDFGIERDYSYLVMRYVESTQTLGSLMYPPSLDFEQSLPLIGQTAEALSYAHQHGVVHRDVKPSNILIDGHDWALLSDFGLAKVEESVTSHLTDTGKSIGTAAYMSPEQAQGRSTVDHRTDIYALGVIVYEIATGSIPHDAPTSLAILLKRTTEPPTPPRKLNPKLNEWTEQVILRALATDPKHRYDNAANFAKALKASVANQSVSGIAADVKQRTQDFTFTPVEPATKGTSDFTSSPPDRERIGTSAGTSTGSHVPPPHFKDRVLAILRHPLLLAVVGGSVTTGLILLWNGGAFSSAAIQNRIDTSAPLAAVSSTATFTVTPTPTPTATPTNTALPIDTPSPPSPTATETSVPPTSTPTATAPSPTHTPTLPPAPPTITATPTPGIPDGVLTLLKPISLDNPSYGPTEFEWQWSGDLPPEFGFEVRVWQEGEPPAGAHDAVLDNRNGRIEKIGADRYRLNVDIRNAAGVRGRGGQYWWTVVLVQVNPDYIDLGKTASPAPLRFEAGGGGGGSGGGNNNDGGSGGGIS